MKLPVRYDDFHHTERWQVRNEYVRIQRGLCWYCKAPLDGEPAEKVRDKTIKPHLYPKGFFNNPIHLHHNHVTGMTVGAVHCHCNAVLWEYEGA